MPSIHWIQNLQHIPQQKNEFQCEDEHLLHNWTTHVFVEIFMLLYVVLSSSIVEIFDNRFYDKS